MKTLALVAVAGLTLSASALACPDLSGRFEKACMIDNSDHGAKPEYEKSRFPEGKVETQMDSKGATYNLGYFTVKADGKSQGVSIPDIDGNPVATQAAAVCEGDHALKVLLKGMQYGLLVQQTEVYSLKSDGDLAIQITNETALDSSMDVTARNDESGASSDRIEYSVTCKRVSALREASH